MDKKIVLIFLCVSILFSLSCTAFAETSVVAKVGDNEYNDYSTAWKAVSENGGTIEVLADWILAGCLSVPEGKTITVNMNGHNIRRNINLGYAIGSGEIFLVKPNAQLVVNGGTESIEHKGILTDGLWIPAENGNISLYGGLISGGANSDGGGGIHIQKNAKVTLNNVTVAGNNSYDGSGAGGIRLQHEDSKLVLNNSRVCYNVAYMGGGGGIRMEGENSYVTVINSSIDNNSTTRDNSDGGGIQINNGTVEVDGSSQISYNYSAQRGGGIYVYKGSLNLKPGSILASNTAKKEGGAIYVDSGVDIVCISSDVIGNSVTNEEGGGLYVNNSDDVTITNARFIANTAKKEGGAIYVDSDNNVTLAGKCEIHSSSPNNLYITSASNIKSAQMETGSRVGLYASWDATSSNPIITSYSDISHFISDKAGYEIVGETDKIYYNQASSDGQTSVPSTYTVNGVDYALKQGTFTFNSDHDGNREAMYFYSDGYFAQSPLFYNEHLATMSVNMVMAASVSTLGERDYTQEYAAENITDLMGKLGCSNIKINYPKPDYYGDDAKPLSTIGYAISNKAITLDDSEYTLIPVAIRGAGYADEWASNVTLGDTVGEAEGFSDAATQVMDGINEYIDEYGIEAEKVKFWIVGYSRAGATANIVSKRLTDIYGGESVYGYTFEAPKGGVKSEIKHGATYANIHNVINKADIVPHVGPVDMGFIRYGVDVYVPGHTVGTDLYKEQKTKMIAQLAKLNPKLKFDDYFHEASVEYFWATVGDKTDGWVGYDNYIVENSRPKYKTAEDWIPFFINQLQKRSLTDEVKNSEYNRLSSTWKGFRHFYSDHKWYMKNTDYGIKEIVSVGKVPEDKEVNCVLTFEQALANVFPLYYSLSGDRKKTLMDSFDVDKIKSKIDTTHLWTYVIDEWDDLSYTNRNKEIKKLWEAIGIEDLEETVLTNDEKEILRIAFPVILDVLLDFVAEDYDHNDQDCLGTLAHNVSNILLSHYSDITCSWIRSYDSFYEFDGEVIPVAPTVDTESGVYKSSVKITINKKKDTTYYYTTDGTIPDENSTLYTDDGIVLSPSEQGSIAQYTLKIIAVKDGISSEVSTFCYIVSELPFILSEEDAIIIKNLDEEAVLIVAGYSGNKLCDAKTISMEADAEMTLSEIGLDTNGAEFVKAFLWKDFKTLTPLCESKEIRIPEQTEDEDE